MKHILIILFLGQTICSAQNDTIFHKNTFNTSHTLTLLSDSSYNEQTFSVTCTDHNTFGSSIKGKYQMRANKLILMPFETMVWDSRRESMLKYNDSIINKKTELYKKKCNGLVLLVSTDTTNYSEYEEFKKVSKKEDEIDLTDYWKNVDIRNVSRTNNKYSCLFE